MSPTLYVLIGIQGSGKSTWARANAGRLESVIVASDEIRNEMVAAGIDPTDLGDQVFATLEDRLAQHLSAGRNVIADATHVRRSWRANQIAIARRLGARVVAIWFDLPMVITRERNARKPGGDLWGDMVIPDTVLREMTETFEPPGADEFDEIVTVGE
jgi:predicted kinase